LVGAARLYSGPTEVGAAEAEVGIERIEVPFAWEFADPRSTPARWRPPAPPMRPSGTLARPNSSWRRSSGQREGFPLPAELYVVGYLACKPAAAQGP
jgi:hypothetical protein